MLLQIPATVPCWKSSIQRVAVSARSSLSVWKMWTSRTERFSLMGSRVSAGSSLVPRPEHGCLDTWLVGGLDTYSKVSTASSAVAFLGMGKAGSAIGLTTRVPVASEGNGQFISVVLDRWGVQ